MDINNFSDSHYTIRIILKLFLVYNIIRNIEFFLLRREFKKGGLYYWPVLRLRDMHVLLRFTRILDVLCGYRSFFGMLTIASACAILLVTGIFPSIDRLLFIPVFISNLVIGYRIQLGWDGSDKLANLLNVCLFFCVCAFPTPSIEKITLVFIAAQVVLAYFTGSVSKTFSRVWRNGTAMIGIFSTTRFGNAAMLRVLMGAGKTAQVTGSWMIIMIQLALSVSILLPMNIFLILLGVGLVFHLLNNILFKLNRFVFAFLAAYPALIYIKLTFFKQGIF
jgi:hypothetical protein